MKNDKRIIAAVLCFAMLIQPGSMGLVMAENQEGTETVSEEKVMNSSKLSSALLITEIEATLLSSFKLINFTPLVTLPIFDILHY